MSTYKTAWRIGHQIRSLMADGDEMLRGHVELDEAYVCGRRSGKRGRGAADKTIVMGTAERGGKIAAQTITNVRQDSLRGEGHGYPHGHVEHGAKEWNYYDYSHDTVHNKNAMFDLLIAAL